MEVKGVRVHAKELERVVTVTHRTETEGIEAGIHEIALAALDGHPLDAERGGLRPGEDRTREAS
jgi:hypothetical protein